MSGYLLDTNIIRDLIRDPAGVVAQHLATIDPRDVCTSIVVAAELQYGCAKKGTAKLSARVKGVLIGAHALALKKTLVTDNVREFSRIPGLMLENWRER